MRAVSESAKCASPANRLRATGKTEAVTAAHTLTVASDDVLFVRPSAVR